MAIAPTGAIYKSLSFDNTSSRNYGVYITGEAVYNAPARDVEMITIPGRNGAYALDNGRFENITVSYPAGIFADNESDFAQAISDFRNFLCSKKGYCRLTDEYNANEYRMAIYKSGLEVTPAQLRAGEFEIVFECRPQRFLTSGETATAVANNGTITNPTLFESKPLLEVTGYGNIGIGSDTLSVVNTGALGEIKVSSAVNNSSATLDLTNVETGDSLYHASSSSIQITAKVSGAVISDCYFVSSSGMSGRTIQRISTKRVDVLLDIKFTDSVKGTSNSKTSTANVKFTVGGTDYTAVFTVVTSYNGTSTISLSTSYSGLSGSGLSVSFITKYIPAFYANSTKVALPTPLYIDLDLGEAYGTLLGEELSFNNAVVLPAELPVLAPGSNTITYDNTVTQFKVTPRWWKV